MSGRDRPLLLFRAARSSGEITSGTSKFDRREEKLPPVARRRCCGVTATRGHTCECQPGAVECDHTYLDSNKFQFNTSNQTSLMDKTTVTRPIGMQSGTVTFSKARLLPLLVHI